MISLTAKCGCTLASYCVNATLVYELLVAVLMQYETEPRYFLTAYVKTSKCWSGSVVWRYDSVLTPGSLVVAVVGFVVVVLLLLLLFITFFFFLLRSSFSSSKQCQKYYIWIFVYILCFWLYMLNAYSCLLLDLCGGLN